MIDTGLTRRSVLHTAFVRVGLAVYISFLEDDCYYKSTNSTLQVEKRCTQIRQLVFELLSQRATFETPAKITAHVGDYRCSAVRVEIPSHGSV